MNGEKVLMVILIILEIITVIALIFCSLGMLACAIQLKSDYFFVYFMCFLSNTVWLIINGYTIWLLKD